MLGERTSVGLDVHARSVAAAAIDGVTGEVVQARLTPSHDQIRAWIEQLDGPVAVAYEAGPQTGRMFLTWVADVVESVKQTGGWPSFKGKPSGADAPIGDRPADDGDDLAWADLLSERR